MAFEVILDNDLCAGGTEAVVHENILERLESGVQIHSDRHALACGEPVGLDHDRGAVVAHICLGCGEFVKGAVFRGRDAVTLHELLGEILGSFDLGGRLVWTERLDTVRFEIVDNALDQRHFRADEHPIDLIVLDEVDEGGVIGRVKLRGVDAVEPHARISRGDGHFAHAVPAQQRVRDCMFACA